MCASGSLATTVKRAAESREKEHKRIRGGGGGGQLLIPNIQAVELDNQIK